MSCRRTRKEELAEVASCGVSQQVSFKTHPAVRRPSTLSSVEVPPKNHPQQDLELVIGHQVNQSLVRLLAQQPPKAKVYRESIAPPHVKVVGEPWGGSVFCCRHEEDGVL
ncbi:hypothetical protein CVT26_009247 [Gymnopilus dilepis]|uniref:Uncharacterized protein n=1 Tax=Gymnopilus dilepis TaxID=231916 RepID=A0A409YRP4_9AGAR|nr:hypothetical protein CVT26_009247 [Gymnopilus dilepis]